MVDGPDTTAGATTLSTSVICQQLTPVERTEITVPVECGPIPPTLP